MIKAVKVLNIISLFFFAAVLLLVYAYLPVGVNMEVEGLNQIHKQSFFYYAIIIFVVINLLLRIIITFGLSKSSELFVAWFSAIIFCVNFYLTLILGFIGFLNNATHIDPSNYAYLNFMGPILLLIWLAGIIFLVIKKS